MYKWPSWTCVTFPSRPYYLERWRRDEGFVLMTINKLSRSKRETSEAGFWLRIDDTHVAILALVWIQTRELLCTQSIRKYNWKIEPWYSRMDRLEFSSLRVVFCGGVPTFFYQDFMKIESNVITWVWVSFVFLLVEEEWGKDTTATSLILACRAFDHNKERPNLSLESESFDVSCMLLSPGEDHLEHLSHSQVSHIILSHGEEMSASFLWP